MNNHSKQGTHIPILRIPAILFWLLPAATVVAADEDRTQVSVSTVAALRFLPTYSAPATTVSLNDSRISVETSGRILRIPARVGDTLVEGELLAELDCSANLALQRQAVAAVVSAKARATLAERQITRTKSLLETRNASEEILNQREADLATARADIDARKAALDKAALDAGNCRILAPFTGIVLQRLASEGEWISPGQPLFQFLDHRRLEVSAQIPLSQIGSLQQAAGHRLMVDGKRFSLRLRHLLPAVDSIARNREARFEFSGQQALPGSSGRVLWQALEPHLPADIPVRRGGEMGVLLEEDGMARFHALPGALEGHPAILDLPPETRLIIEGRQALDDGDPVSIER